MNERDDELDALLAPLRGIKPSEAQLSGWRNAVRGEMNPTKRMNPWMARAVQLTAAAFIGFLVGAWFFRAHSFTAPAEDIFAHSDATFERSHINLD
ncbi:MAG: hypothetical protein AB7K68_07895 [Bacteriovoracia bacterium]